MVWAVIVPFSTALSDMDSNYTWDNTLYCCSESQWSFCPAYDSRIVPRDDIFTPNPKVAFYKNKRRKSLGCNFPFI